MTATKAILVPTILPYHISVWTSIAMLVLQIKLGNIY